MFEIVSGPAKLEGKIDKGNIWLVLSGHYLTTPAGIVLLPEQVKLLRKELKKLLNESM